MVVTGCDAGKARCGGRQTFAVGGRTLACLLHCLEWAGHRRDSAQKQCAEVRRQSGLAGRLAYAAVLRTEMAAEQEGWLALR
jgi:hypothetical protein